MKYCTCKLLVVDGSAYDWEGDTPLGLPYAESVFYETHVKGFTVRHPDVPSELRGTYAGFGHPAATDGSGESVKVSDIFLVWFNNFSSLFFSIQRPILPELNLSLNVS